MKKNILLMILSVLMVMVMVGCGKKEKKRTESDYVGTWVAEYIADEDDTFKYYKKGDTIRVTLDLYKGGNANISWYYVQSEHEGSNVAVKWELNEDGDVVSLSGQYSWGYEYNEEDNTLTNQQFRYVVHKKQ